MMQTTATRQDSKPATDTEVPSETTRTSTTFGFTRRRFCGVAAATISANLLEIPGFYRGDEAMTDGMAAIAQQTGRSDSDIRPFHVNVPEDQSSPNCVGASTRQGGLIVKRSRMNRKVCR